MLKLAFHADQQNKVERMTNINLAHVELKQATVLKTTVMSKIQ